jgi:signal peptidase I
MTVNEKIRQFFFPSITFRYLIRVCLVALSAYLFFGYICTPFAIRGSSMEPTYHDGGFNFCWRLRYLISKPRRFDVVTVRLAGDQVMLLKRVVALEGEEVEFRKGVLFVNSEEIFEPYLRSPCNWNLPSRQVEKGCVYVVGDNRVMPMEQHVFGQADIQRILGAPVW